MRLLLVGPTHPFRGGIAHHTTLLAVALAKRVSMTFVSFRRLYVQTLFPGATDKDNSETPIRIDHVRRELDSLAPWTFFRIGREARDYDAVVLPWWVAFWAPYYLLLLAGLRGRAAVIFVCHNVIEHESSSLKRRITREVLRRGDGFVVQSNEEADRLRALVGSDARIEVSPHPSYDIFDHQRHTKTSARESLAIPEDAEVVLFFGFIRPYKGLDDLLAAFALLAERRPRAYLLVVGECWEGAERYRAQASERCRMVLEYVPNEDVERYVKAADLMALPYLSGSGSGIAQIALGMGVPVVATNIGAFEGVIVDGKTGLLVPPRDPEGLAGALERALDPDLRVAMQAAISRDRDRFSWDALAACVESLAR